MTRRLTKKYGELTAVNRLDLEVRRGEIFGLLGQNGAGKTTTILMLLGLTEPTEGEARVVGLDPARYPREVKRRVGYLPDAVGFYDDMSGRANLRYTANLNGLNGKAAEQAIDEVLRQVGLSDRGGDKVGTYSRGMRQRLGIADALVKDPDILILDEPTTAIDPIGVQEILELLQSLSRDNGLTILLSSHLLSQVQSVCDRVGIFAAGRLIGQGTVQELAARFMQDEAIVEVQFHEDDGRGPCPARRGGPGGPSERDRRGTLGARRTAVARDGHTRARRSRGPRGDPGCRRGGGPAARGAQSARSVARRHLPDGPATPGRGSRPARGRGKRGATSPARSPRQARPARPARQVASPPAKDAARMTATTSTPPRESARPPIPRAGWVVVASKEIGDHVSSIRFVVLVVLLGIAAGIPLYFAADTIREAAEGASEAAAVFLALFTIGEETPYITLRVDTFVALVAPLLGIIFAFDAINSERHDGTLPRLLSQPIHRDDVINGKFAAGLAVIGIVLVAMLAIVSGYGIFRLGIVPEAGEVFRLLAWTAATFVYVALWLAFGLLLSVAIRNTATAALVGFGTWLFLTLVRAARPVVPRADPRAGQRRDERADLPERGLPGHHHAAAAEQPLPGDLGGAAQPERDAGVRAGHHRPGDPGQPADRVACSRSIRAC